MALISFCGPRRPTWPCALRARPSSSPRTEAGYLPQPRDLRHTCASLALSAGVNVLALQRMPAHTSAKVTLDTYANLFDDDLGAVAATLHSRYSREVIRKELAGK